MSFITITFLILGLILLIAGAELLVRGASRLASAVGISPLVIGLTVVALGTSSPELAISIQSVGQGQADLAVGNVIGSNIFNILVILGLSAAITPLIVAQQLIRLDVPLLIGASFLMYWMAWDGRISRGEGAALVVIILVYAAFLIYQTRREPPAVKAQYDQQYGDGRPGGARIWLLNVGMAAAGLVLLVIGARWLVDGAVALARTVGLSELIIGLTIVAAGTSLPEVATSVLAALRGERDIAVGNAVGSSLFNILLVLGLTSVVTGAGLNVAPPALTFDIPVMLAATVATLPIFFTGSLITRWEGWLFLGYYTAYTLYLILDAAEHDALPMFSGVMIAFVLPITIMTLVLLAWRELKARRASDERIAKIDD